ncbi:MAG: phosphatase PAP2 family protein [Acidobacteria bacterium]|nr:MAG: phosphatase PAP2 family protein [Acidobacteriota bacterium]
MTTGTPRAEADRRWSRRELAVLLALAAATTLLFAATPLDFAAGRLFYRPDALNHWPLANRLPWSVLYRAAPWITASLVLGGLAGIAAGALRRHGAWRRSGAFVLLTVVIGPGILINAVFKDHWNRPRPREIVEFGGALRYAPAPLRGESGASFPCGHCSVGFLYGLGWWIWRRRRPAPARLSLVAGLTAGSALGLGRMAAGGHFLSDVIWSALLAFAVAHALYFHVLRIPQHDAASGLAPPTAAGARLQLAVTIAAALGGVAVLLALFVTPHGTPLEAEIPFSTLPRPPRVVRVAARTADVEVALVDHPTAQVSVSGELHGFGLPTSRLTTRVQFDPEPVPTLTYRIEQRGWFTDLSGSAFVRVPAAALEKLVVTVARGNITVTDATAAGVVRSHRVRLDLTTGSGRVRIISAPSR